MTLSFPLAVSKDPRQKFYRDLIAAASGLVSFLCLTFIAHLFWFGLFFGLGLFIFCFVIMRSLDRSGKVFFEVSDIHISIKGDMFGDTIALESLNLIEMRHVDISNKGPEALKWKLWGTGMPGYYSGEYSLRNGKSALVFISNKQQVVYIPRNNSECLLLSVEDPAIFMLALRSQSELKTSAKLA